MFTSYDKAIAALIMPILSLLVLSGFLPEGLATPEIVAGLTGIITGLAAYFVPNKE